MIKLVILGNPKPQQRHRATRMGKFIHQYDPSSKDKDNLALVVQQNAPKEPLIGGLCVDIDFYFPRPKAHFNKKGLKPFAPIEHTKRPDRDNLDKFVLDALSGIFWKDDSQVCDGRIRKLYDIQPRTEITINEI